MGWRLSVVFLAMLKAVAASNICTLTVNYVLCNEVDIPVLHAGQYPVNTTTITALHFNGNFMTALDADVFSNITGMKFIVITNNLLETLESRLFLNLKNLIHLDLTANRITSLPDDIFTSQNELENLLLGHNQIKTLDSRALAPLLSIATLDLSHNPFECDCRLQDTVLWCGARNLNTKAQCKNGTFWRILNTDIICETTTQNTVSESSLFSEEILTTDPWISRKPVLEAEMTNSEEDFLTTQSWSPNITESKMLIANSRTPLWLGIAIFVIAITLCSVVGIVLFRRKTLCFKGRDRVIHIGGAEVVDCGNEFVSSRRQYSYLEDSLSQTALCDEDNLLSSDPTPECVIVRKQSESEDLNDKVKKVQDLPDLAAYAEPFRGKNSPAPVYAVPFGQKTFQKEEDDGLWVQNEIYART